MDLFLRSNPKKMQNREKNIKPEKNQNMKIQHKKAEFYSNPKKSCLLLTSLADHRCDRKITHMKDA